MNNGYFEEGNQIWKLRAKDGRDKLFASPELLWKACCEYFEWCIKHPIYKYEQGRATLTQTEEEKKKNPHNLVKIPTQRPFTMQGLKLYIGCSQAYFTNFKHAQRKVLETELPVQATEDEVIKLKNKQDEASDFLNILDMIEETIYNQKFEGAIVGLYNSMIIARDLNLREGVDKQVTGSIHLSKEPTVFE